MKTQSLKYFIRHKYAWPGGYPMFAVCNDGGALCHACAKENAKLCIAATRSHDCSDWDIYGVHVNWEDSQLYCDNCNAPIESAYGDGK